MRKIAFLLLFATTLFGALPDEGFVTYSRGDLSARTLVIRKITGGQLQGEQVIANKGSFGGDQEGVISHDGKFLAFARPYKTTTFKFYEIDDYHDFGSFDVYVVPLDGSFPATPKKVAQGYFPCWGDDSDGSTKTLYFSRYDGKDIYKATINSSGDASNVVKHFDTPTNEGDLHMQGSPDGKKIAFREAGTVYIYHVSGSKAGQKFNAGGGCQPSWTATSRWLMHANKTVSRDDGSPVNLPGSGDYHYGSSQDMKYVVFRTQGDYKNQNKGYTLVVYSLTATDASFTVNTSGGTTISDDGSWCDIHSGSSQAAEVNINSFTADPSEITAGSSTKLEWLVSGATKVLIDDQEVSGSSVTKSPAATTTYTLKAEGVGGPKTKTVTVTVTPPRLDAIFIDPSLVTLKLSESKSFTAVAKDQSGNDFTATINWSVSGTGTLSATTGNSVTYTAPSDEAGAVNLTASSGDVEAIAAITVVDPNAIAIKINSGGADIGDWIAGASYLVAGQTGTPYLFSNAPSTAGLTNPAPAEVYQSLVHYDHSYNIGGIPEGDYTVRIHFYDQVGGDRKMNYSINGTQVISNLNVADEAGGTDKALIKEFDVTVGSDQAITITATAGTGNDVFESAIEVIGKGNTLAPETIVFADDLAGKNFNTGDKISVTWSASADVGSVVLKISLDNGLSWLDMLSSQVGRTSSNWGNVEWTVPADLDGIETNSSSVKIEVGDYTRPAVKAVSATFSLNEQSSTDQLQRGVPGTNFINLAHGKLSITRAGAASLTVQVYSVAGRLIREQFFKNGSDVALHLPLNSSTVVVRLLTVQGQTVHRMVMTR